MIYRGGRIPTQRKEEMTKEKEEKKKGKEEDEKEEKEEREEKETKKCKEKKMRAATTLAIRFRNNDLLINYYCTSYFSGILTFTGEV